MNGFSVVGLLFLSQIAQMPTVFWQVTPHYQINPTPKVSKPGAVLLIHGLMPHVISPGKARKPDPASWQLPGSKLVKQLGSDFDVYGFSYAQLTPVEYVSHSEGLRTAVQTLKEAGYSEIVLIGHSAGGLIVRHFAEVHPKSGVTKVIAVASPYSGSRWANIPVIGLPSTQIAFIKSLSPGYRNLEIPDPREFPKEIQICCVVCEVSRFGTDFVVGLNSQWPQDLRKQGVPATYLKANHFEVVRVPEGAKLISELAKGKLRRWNEAEVEQARLAISKKLK